MKTEHYDLTVEEGGQRLDLWLSRALPHCSRSRWQELIRDGLVRVDGKTCKPNQTLQGGMGVTAEVPPPRPLHLEPENLPLNILFEDEHVVVLDKSAGMVVHPSAGHERGTLVHGLLAHCPNLGGIGGVLRPGIVHRLDKDTSGVMVVAKTDDAMRELLRQFREREVRKLYVALVHGIPQPPTGHIDQPIGRHATDRRKMTVHAPVSRHALTHYRIVESFDSTALLELRIETGRTHQIRVHMSARGHAILGDREYGGRRAFTLPLQPERQLLHARSLTFTHPTLQVELEFNAPIPQDMHAMIQALRQQHHTGEEAGTT